MPTLAEYRRNLAVESGPYVGPESYNVRAMFGSDVSKIVCLNYPIKSGIGQNDLYRERPLYRPTARLETDKNRYVLSYDPPTGTLVPDLAWTFSPFTDQDLMSYGELEAFTYGDFEEQYLTYENMEGVGITGMGERFEILGPWDAPTMHQLINDGLKQCWLVVDVPCTPIADTSRFDLSVVTPWLQDANHVRQAGVLAVGEDPSKVDPFQRMVYGVVERDGGTMVFNTGSRSFNANDVLYLRCYKRAYDHCRASGGDFGDQVGLSLETDEAPIEREWATSSALVVGWRRFGHILEVAANQRLIRDQAAAAAWYNDRTHQHFTAVQPTLTFRRARHFGPVFR